MIKTSDNFNGDFASKLRPSESNINVTVADFKKIKSNNLLFSFFSPNEDKRAQKQDDCEIIISTKKDNQDADNPKFSIQTGNYIGKFYWDGNEINIGSRFGEKFLKRMLNFANDVYLDDVDVSGEKNEKLDFSRVMLYYLFVQALEKAFLLGLPKAYRSIEHHESKLIGRLDINRYIKNDIPFTGKISSVTRVQKEVQEIVDVLYKAITVIDGLGPKAPNEITKNIRHIKSHLKEIKSDSVINKGIIEKAKNSKALQNPTFSSYKTVLRYAEYIIDLNSLEQTKKESKDKTFGFLVNVAELFEIYITKLLARGFPEWSVSSPPIDLYKGMFYARKIIPDIVMERGNDILVFDTKYKRMNYIGNRSFGMGDVDRNDFFQINTYMSYYKQHGKNVLYGGLLYPLSQPFDKEKCHADHWLGCEKSSEKFIIDGVEHGSSDDPNIACILSGEKAFIDRIRNCIEH